MFNRVGLQTRPKYLQHSEQDWYINNQLQYHRADQDCSKSEAVVAECNRLCDEVALRTENERAEVERKFDLRIGDVDFWRNEVDCQIAGLQESVDQLIRYRDRVQGALSSCTQPMTAGTECLAFREKRLSIDLVNDKPQQQLQKYMVLLEDVRVILRRTLDQVEEQIRSNRAVKYNLLRDVSDKYAALQVDIHAAGCSPENTGNTPLNFNCEMMIPPKAGVTLAEWESYTMHNIKKAEHERKKSDEIQVLMEEVLQQTYSDLHLQHENALSTLRDRIGELHVSKERMEERLARVVEQIEEIRSTLEKLNHSIDCKIPILSLTNNRMEERRMRPRTELCRDHVDLELEKEAMLLTQTIHELQDRLKQSEEMKRLLQQTRLSLEKDISIKANSIYIDEVECMSLLSSVNHIHH